MIKVKGETQFRRRGRAGSKSLGYKVIRMLRVQSWIFPVKILQMPDSSFTIL